MEERFWVLAILMGFLAIYGLAALPMKLKERKQRKIELWQEMQRR